VQSLSVFLLVFLFLKNYFFVSCAFSVLFLPATLPALFYFGIIFYAFSLYPLTPAVFFSAFLLAFFVCCLLTGGWVGGVVCFEGGGGELGGA
jgi:hypothetical protein